MASFRIWQPRAGDPAQTSGWVGEENASEEGGDVQRLGASWHALRILLAQRAGLAHRGPGVIQECSGFELYWPGMLLAHGVAMANVKGHVSRFGSVALLSGLGILGLSGCLEETGGSPAGSAGGLGPATTISCDEVPRFFSNFSYKCLSNGSVDASWQDLPESSSDTAPAPVTRHCHYSCPGACQNDVSPNPANGTQFLAEACNSTTPITTIGDRVPQIDSLLLTISVTDGFMSYARNNTYQIDVATRKVTYTWANPVSDSRTAPEPHVETASATAEQIDALLAAVQGTPWRTTKSCASQAVDGAPYPASLLVTSSLQGKFNYQTTDAKCTPSDHGATGDVISCSSFGSIETLVHAILPGGTATQCRSYW